MRPPLVLITEAELALTSPVPFKVATATTWSINTSIKLFRSPHLATLCSQVLIWKECMQRRHLTDIYIIYTPYNFCHQAKFGQYVSLHKTLPIYLPGMNILILWFIKLCKYISYIKFTMQLISTNKYFLPATSKF